MASKLATVAIEIAITQIGQQEKPKFSNWGHPVQDYLASVDINFPASWCMAFVYWCFNTSATNIGTVNPLVRTGGVLHAYNSATSHHEIVPQPGDIMILDYGNSLGHTGIVESVAPGLIHTIEGNTNDTGSREGYEVIRRTRLQSKVKGYLRY